MWQGSYPTVTLATFKRTGCPLDKKKYTVSFVAIREKMLLIVVG